MITVFLFSFSSLVLKAQIPAAIDTKIKSDNMRNFQVEEIKVRWKKAALENCPGVPCVPPAIPGAPTSVVATAGNTSASIAFLAPTNNGGSVITGYTVTSNPGGITGTGSGSPITVSGLTNGTSYTFTVVAINAVGSSAASAASTAVTSAVCPTSTVTDVDGNIYNTVAIGTQCWTKENLKVTKYNNRDIIPDSTNASNSNWGTVAIGARTDYVGVSGYVGTYGYLYNWHAATDPRKICPSGWHVPTDGEWRILIQSIDPTYITTNTSSTTAGGSMKTAGTSDWLTLNTGTNASGFSAKGGGFRRSFTGSGLSSDGNFDNININGFFWSTTTNNLNTGEAYFCFLLFVIDDVQMLFNKKGYGQSVRCVKD
jgi:uncharacterized protein (TIGR02145 family)